MAKISIPERKQVKVIKPRREYEVEKGDFILIEAMRAASPVLGVFDRIEEERARDVRDVIYFSESYKLFEPIERNGKLIPQMIASTNTIGD